MKKIIAILLLSLSFSLAQGADDEVTATSVEAVSVQAVSEVEYDDEWILANGKKRCVRNGGTFYEYSNGSYACIYKAASKKAVDVESGDLVGGIIDNKKDCHAAGGTWATNSAGSFCYRRLEAAKKIMMDLDDGHVTVLKARERIDKTSPILAMKIDGEEVKVVRKRSADIKIDGIDGEMVATIVSYPCNDPLNPGDLCDGLVVSEEEISSVDGSFITCDNGMIVPVSVGCDGIGNIDIEKMGQEIETIGHVTLIKSQESSGGNYAEHGKDDDCDGIECKKPGDPIPGIGITQEAEKKEALKEEIKAKIALIQERIQQILAERKQ